MLIFVEWQGETSDDNHKTVFGLKRDSTEIGSPAASGNRLVGISGLTQGYHTEDNTSTQDAASYNFLDTNRSAGTTQITYKATILNHTAVTLYNNRTVINSDSDEHEYLTSSILVMEVAARIIKPFTTHIRLLGGLKMLKEALLLMTLTATR